MADGFDIEGAHRHFAADCFNRSWALIGKADRTAEDDTALVALAQTSLWHWTERPDCTDKHLSVAHWLLARVYCLTGRAAEADRYAAQSLAFARRPGVPPYFLAYAHEACARAASLQGQADAVRDHLQAARGLATDLKEEDRKMLLGDLATIGVGQ